MPRAVRRARRSSSARSLRSFVFAPGHPRKRSIEYRFPDAMSLQPTPPALNGDDRPPRAEGPLRIAGRLIEPSLNRIAGPEGTVGVEPKLMQVLLCLARARGG